MHHSNRVFVTIGSFTLPSRTFSAVSKCACSCPIRIFCTASLYADTGSPFKCGKDLTSFALSNDCLGKSSWLTVRTFCNLKEFFLSMPETHSDVSSWRPIPPVQTRQRVSGVPLIPNCCAMSASSSVDDDPSSRNAYVFTCVPFPHSVTGI